MSIAELLFPTDQKPRRIHLLGVAGSGMNGIASLLLSLGHHVSGSDRVSSPEIERLQNRGLLFKLTQEASDAHGIDLLIYSSAIRTENLTLKEALQLGIPTAKRAEALATLLDHKEGILISGMHGKTTTTSMAAHLMTEAGEAPSYYIGAEIPLLGRNAYWNKATSFFIAEGDESDGTLIHYHPKHTILLNIEPEHLDFYPNLAAIEATYQQLVNQTLGKIFYWADDPGAKKVAQHHPRAISVGSHPQAHYHYEKLELFATHSSFELFYQESYQGKITLNIPGKHHVANAMLVIALCRELGISLEHIQHALCSFSGAKRRFEIIYQSEDYLLIDDYAHHPTEITATLATARNVLAARNQERQAQGLPPGRLLSLFQPHRYSRTAAFYDQFAQALLATDLLLLTDIYPASEQPLAGISSQRLLEKVEALQRDTIDTSAQEKQHPTTYYIPSLAEVRPQLASLLKPGDLLLSLGAGNIHQELEGMAADLRVATHLRSYLRKGALKLYEPLYQHTTMRIGGPAHYWIELATEEEATEIIQFCHEYHLPTKVIGRGSNLLVKDGGVDGVLLHFHRGHFAQIKVEGEIIEAGVGVRLKQLSGAARQAGLTGFEWMDGIPGSLGGSLKMNAGAMKKETWAQVESIRYINTQGHIATATPAMLEIEYRYVPFLQNNYVLSAKLRGQKAPQEQIDQLLQEAVTHRRTTQPIQYPSAGCIFKNPPGLSAGKIIDELGLKNASVGHATVSEIHGNFIVNKGGATLEEIRTLIQKIQQEAQEEYGIILNTEVEIIGKEKEESFPIYHIF